MEDDQSLLYACYINDIHLIKERLKHAKPAHLKKSTQETGTPLHAAAINENREAVDLLLEAGANMEAGNYMGNNAMLACIEAGKLEMAEYLIGKGSNINKKGCQNRNALSQLICYSWDKVFAEYLIAQGCLINQTARDQCSLLNDAASSDNEEAIDFLLDNGIERSYINSALCWAIIHNAVHAVDLLLDKGADLDEMYASCKGIEKGLYHIVAIRKGYDSMLKLLLERGVDFKKTPDRPVVVHIDKSKLSPLGYAKEHALKWPGEAHLPAHIQIIEMYK